MNKANFRFKRNISKELSPVIKKYTQLLYKKGLSDNTITHYRCHINRLATFCNVEPDKLTIKNFDKKNPSSQIQSSKWNYIVSYI